MRQTVGYLLIHVDFISYISPASGLQLHLQKFPRHFRLFKRLAEREEPPTAEEQAIASCQKPLDDATFNRLVGRLDKVDGNIADAFNWQSQHATVSAKYLVLMYGCLQRVIGSQI